MNPQPPETWQAQWYREGLLREIDPAATSIEAALVIEAEPLELARAMRAAG